MPARRTFIVAGVPGQAEVGVPRVSSLVARKIGQERGRGSEGVGIEKTIGITKRIARVRATSAEGHKPWTETVAKVDVALVATCPY